MGLVTHKHKLVIAMLNTVGYDYRYMDDPNTVITLSNIAIAMGNHKTVVT